jgi:hypothetical protein
MERPSWVYVIFLMWIMTPWKGNAIVSFHQYEDGSRKLSETMLGQFKISWDQAEPYVLISHSAEPDRVLFQTLPSWPFITVGYATDSNPPIVDGNYKVNEWTLFETPYQSIKQVIMQDDSFTIIGDIWGKVTQATYNLHFFMPSQNAQKLSNQLEFNVTVNPLQGPFNRVFLNYWCEPAEQFFGFGVQYSHWNLKGRRVPILVAEQGIGRGAEPVTTLLNVLADRAGGDWSTSYSPKPVYITSHNRSLILLNSEVSKS